MARCQFSSVPEGIRTTTKPSGSKSLFCNVDQLCVSSSSLPSAEFEAQYHAPTNSDFAELALKQQCLRKSRGDSVLIPLISSIF